MFTVKQLSKIAGVTPRTLHYYDEIGLLKPSRIGDNGYRYYGEETLFRLQQILLYRELGMPLENIRDILDQQGFDVIRALEQHKKELSKRIIHLQTLITTVDRTLLHMKEKVNMPHNQIFDGFSDEQQAEYEKEALGRYDPVTVKQPTRNGNRLLPQKDSAFWKRAKPFTRI
jgi:DNA-binding transcriptional MerR regulator